MKHDRTVRSLSLLEQSGTTARVLNLSAIAKRPPVAPRADEEGGSKPLFHNPVLNRSIILKHRLRRDEQEIFGGTRLMATKVMMPIDSNDLDAGAHFFFIGQRGYTEMLAGILSAQSRFASHDRMVLQILDECSTLDPFVLREQLRRHGIEPSSHYFEIGPADMSRMHTFVAREIAPLARMSEGEGVPLEASSRLSRKLLSHQADIETQPLRHTLKLAQDDYREGVFSWKAFLYYKWCLAEARPQILQVMQEIAAVKLSGSVSPQVHRAIQAQHFKLKDLMEAALQCVGSDIAIYDQAYAGLVRGRDPAPFRAFLLRAPSLFDQVGEGLGAIQHVVSYWRYRVSSGRVAVDPTDFSEILREFTCALQAFEAVEPLKVQLV